VTNKHSPAAGPAGPKSRDAADKDTPRQTSKELPKDLPKDLPPMTLQRLRHDIRNYLNAIKLSCALLQRQTREPAVHESSHEIEKSADHINELVTRFMGDAEAAKLIGGGKGGGPGQG